MKVKILEHTPNPERLIAAAAKLCYSSSTVDEIMENLTDANVEKFLGKLMDMGHASPIEHVCFTFGIEGVSRALTHQLVRHRHASYSQKSQRYVNEKGFGYIIPPEIAKDKTLKRRFEEKMYDIQRYYDFTVSRLMHLGSTREEAQQDARFILPNACTTSIVCTMNVRSLLHFFNQRCCNRAQWEIRSVAEEMLRQCNEVAPILFKNAGAPCVSGKCPEGSMSCGGKHDHN